MTTRPTCPAGTPWCEEHAFDLGGTPCMSRVVEFGDSLVWVEKRGTEAEVWISRGPISMRIPIPDGPTGTPLL